MSQAQPRNDLAKSTQATQAPPQQAGPQALEALFEKHKGTLEKVAAKHITPDRLIKVALIARSTNPMLMQCTSESFLRSVIQAAELGLEPSGQYGGAHLVPRKNHKTGKYECTLVPDYRGLIELARRSGEITHVDVGAVYDNDEFVFERGLNPQLSHRPALTGERGELLGFWAVVFFRGGQKTFEVMRRDEVEAIRNDVAYWDKGPWKSDFEAMGKKTVIKRTMNLCPKSKEYRRAEEIENEVEAPTQSELPALPAQTGIVQVELTKQTRAQKIAGELKKGRVVDVKAGETEEQASARVQSEHVSVDDLPPGDPPGLPPPSEDEIPFGADAP